MKLVIQIPCLNEAETLPLTLAELPREVEGFSEVEWIVIDDGSTDGTGEVAISGGVDLVVRHVRNLGLAQAFTTGIETALRRGADVIVNTDADNQYRGADIPKLVQPILRGEAEIVIGARPISQIEHFSLVKKGMQRLGSWVVRLLSSTSVQDAPSGFRALSREAAMRINVFNEYTYTLETIIQAGRKGIAVVSVPVSTNRDLRPSRLVKGITSYVRKSVLVMLRIFMTYRPFEFFAVPGVVSLLAGLGLGMRFLYFFAQGEGTGHVQSVILSALLLGSGLFLLVFGLLADLISVNRKLLEKVNVRLHLVEESLRRHERPVPAEEQEVPQERKVR